MSALFSSPKSPSLPPLPPPAPTLANTDTDVAARQQAMRLERGRSATMLTGGGGVSDLGATSKILLGR